MLQNQRNCVKKYKLRDLQKAVKIYIFKKNVIFFIICTIILFSNMLIRRVLDLMENSRRIHSFFKVRLNSGDFPILKASRFVDHPAHDFLTSSFCKLL